MPEKMAVLDFGSQYTHTIARRFRQMGVYAEIIPANTPASVLKERNYKGIDMSGSPASVYDSKAPKVDPAIWDIDVPKLATCYGMQLAAYARGGKVAPGEKKEYGETEITVRSPEGIFKDVPKEQIVWMSHGDSVLNPEEIGFDVLARSRSGLAAAMADTKNKTYAVQFHPEVSHTKYGIQILHNFAFDICGFKGDWTMEGYVDRALREIKDWAGTSRVTVATSAGVDSTVTAKLIQTARGNDGLDIIYAKTGLSREGEDDWAVGQLNKMGFSVSSPDWSGKILNLLYGVVDAKLKRKLIGKIYAEKLKLERQRRKSKLAQGTLYPDLIESGWSLLYTEDVEQLIRAYADQIKEHHNVDSMQDVREQGRMIEPLRYLFKDEVRKVAKIVGLPPEIADREPFPGPGLAVRHVGNVRVGDKFDETEAFVMYVARKHGLEGYLFPVLTVGVQGDARTYSNMAILEGDNEFLRLREASKEIIRGTKEVNRVAYCLFGEPDRNQLKATPTMPIGPESMALLRKIDAAGRSVITNDESYKLISQIPFNLFAGYWAGMRPFITEDFMTGRPPRIPEEMSWDTVYEMGERMYAARSDGIAPRGVLLDLSDKPPGTTEGE